MLVQSLSKELYDKIFELIFTANQQAIRIDGSYTFPPLLRVDPTYREIFAESYYSQTIFAARCSHRYREVDELAARRASRRLALRAVLVQRGWSQPAHGTGPAKTGADFSTIRVVSLRVRVGK